jgi:mannose-6-phosphate isomerase-like protein (cupin superfamily)
MSNNINKTSYGYDITWIETELYTSKIMIFEKTGGKTPIAFHKDTIKSWFVNSGRFKVTYVDTKTGQIFEKDIGEGTVFHVPALMPCGIECTSDNGSISQTSNINNQEDFYQLSP